MTQPPNYSDWQRGTIPPELEGVYEKRCEMEFEKLPLGRFKAGKWFVEENGKYSMWQTDSESPWQWRGLVEGTPGE